MKLKSFVFEKRGKSYNLNVFFEIDRLLESEVV